jgi:hypothetical protein
MAFLPGFPGMGAQNDLSIRKGMTAIHRHIEEKADGSKITHEKTIESIDSKFMRGDPWLHNPAVRNVDKASDCFRSDKTLKIIKETRIKEDKDGNKTIDEKAVRMEDDFETHGAKLIGNSPEIKTDGRISLLGGMSSGKDPFTLLGGGKDFIPLLGD